MYVCVSCMSCMSLSSAVTPPDRRACQQHLLAAGLGVGVRQVGGVQIRESEAVQMLRPDT